MKIDDHNFIKEIKNGNTKALDFIIDHYSNLVFKIVGNVLNTLRNAVMMSSCQYGIILKVWMKEKEILNIGLLQYQNTERSTINGGFLNKTMCLKRRNLSK